MMMSYINSQWLNNVALKAGKIIMDIYNNIDVSMVIDKKDDNSPLTEADRQANQYICSQLEEMYPEIPIISEENKQIDYSTRKSWSKAWLVDPLDGTKEFIKRNGEFTVNIALIENGQPVHGVVYAPALKDLYYASKGKGSFLVKNGIEQKLKAHTFSKSDHGLKVVASRSHINNETQVFMNQFSEPEIVSCGSSLKFMLIARGQADIYPRIAPTMEWDTGAAQAILEEAGGKVFKYESNDPLTYNKENLLNPFFVATGNILQSA